MAGEVRSMDYANPLGSWRLLRQLSHLSVPHLTGTVWPTSFEGADPNRSSLAAPFLRRGLSGDSGDPEAPLPEICVPTPHTYSPASEGLT